MKLEADKFDDQTAYALLRVGEVLTDSAIEKALKYARKRRRPFVEVYVGDKFQRLMLAEPEAE